MSYPSSGFGGESIRIGRIFCPTSDIDRIAAMDVPFVSNLQKMHGALVDRIRPLKRVIVAFSAGVDSTLVLRVALDALGRENVLAATGVSPSLASRELQSVKDLAGVLDARLELVNTSEMDSPQYTANPTTRCFHCKSELY